MAKTFLQWSSTHKLVLFLGILSVCLFISTLTLAFTPKGEKQSITEAIERTSKLARHGKLKNYRLPRNILPQNYNLTLWPHVSNKTFHGVVLISVNVVKPTKEIVFHSSSRISIDNLSVRSGNETLVTVMDIKPDDTDKVYVFMRKELINGIYEIAISYTGRLDYNYVGFYSSTLNDGRNMVASKFEPTYAREAFPCFDEPDFKATYDITLVKPASYIALSNMPNVSSEEDDTKETVAVTFKRSVPMSTYLACFVICDFISKETTIDAHGIGDNFTLRAFSQKGELQKIDFSLDIGKRATEFYIKYYQVPFPLPKLDMIAIPDYVSGATEHWGLITYRETSFLVDPATASAKNKIAVANTVAHELAHMWFGNLVTMKWWDDLWLNEGFATYMQCKSLNVLEPSWTMLDQFLTKTMHPVLVTDAKLSSHPIVQKVDTPDQITAIFDAISYNKGASVLRMLEGFVGEENFRKGISQYLKIYEFGNSVTQDLLNVLEPFFKKNNPELNLSYIMDTWTRQMGYPVLTVKSAEEGDQIIVSQKRFLLDPNAVYENDTQYNYRWFIPITYKTNKETYKNVIWFTDKAENVILTLKNGEDWLKINNNQVGYYRVNYEAATWAKLTGQLKDKSPQLTISDRSQLINDVYALAEAKEVPYSIALNLSTYLPMEEDFVPWETASGVFAGLAGRLLNSRAYDDLQRYVQSLVVPLYDKQDWNAQKGSVMQGLLRTRVLSLACKYGLPKAEKSVRGIFTNWLESHDKGKPIAVEPDLRDLVYYQGMKAANKTEWEKVWKIYLNTTDVHEALKLRTALSAPRDTSLLRKYLALSWDERYIRSQDYLNLLSFISSNPSGTALIWDDVRSRWPQLVERFSLNSRYLGNLIPGITNTFNTELKLKEMESFFEQYPDAGAGESARRRALETVRNNIKWTKDNEPTVAEWLRTYP